MTSLDQQPQREQAPEVLAALARDLIEAWNADHKEMLLGQRGRHPDTRRFICIFGLSAHAYRLAEAALDMFDRGLVIEALPLVRFSYECALKSIWMAQNEEGLDAFLNQEVGQRRAIKSTFSKTTTPLFQSSAKDFPILDEGLVPTASDGQAKFFERLCDDLQPGGADAYIHYRFMSCFCHPNPHVVDPYLTVDHEGEVAGLSTIPNQKPDGLWLYYTAISLVWAGTAVDFIDANKVRRDVLRKAAHELGIPRELHLTFDAQQRIARARRAKWKGRRKKE